MRPILEQLSKKTNESFVAKKFEFNYYPTPWHYHKEFELALIVESSGKRFIGDNISNFQSGDIIFLGANLPHTFRNEEIYYRPKSNLKAKSIVVHFLEESLGKDFLALPEAGILQSLFKKSTRGMDIIGKTNKEIHKGLYDLLELKGLDRWLKLIDLLKILATTKDFRYISKEAMYGQNEKESIRMNKVFQFVMKNYGREIRISEVAALVNMADNSFSRYFSQRTKKTFVEFLNEIRLNHACKLLIQHEMNVAQICFECGFNNLSHFNAYFRKVYKKSPMAYRKEFLK